MRKPTKAKAPAAEKSPFEQINFFPLTKQREVAAVDMGLKYGFVASYQRQFVFRDTIIVLWLCTIPAEGAATWTVDRAEREPDSARKEAYKWAESVGIGIASNAFAEAQVKFVEMMQEVKKAKGVPVLPTQVAKEDDSGEC